MNPIIIAGGIGWVATITLGWLLLQARETVGEERQACDTRMALATAEASEAARMAYQQAYERMQADLEAQALRASARASQAETRVAELEARGETIRTVIKEVYINEPEAAQWAATVIPHSLRVQLAAASGP